MPADKNAFIIGIYLCLLAAQIELLRVLLHRTLNVFCAETSAANGPPLNQWVHFAATHNGASTTTGTALL